jgi:transposase
VASERDRPSVQQKREEFLAATEAVEGGRLVFLDESGSHVSMIREHAWAPVGVRGVGRVPRNRGKVLTMIGALPLDGVEALMTVEGGTSGAVFLTFVREYRVPTLRPGDLVVMDNLGAHHATGVKEAIRAAGADVLYLPPYGPDLNPIELCWSKMKALLRKLVARTVRRLKVDVQKATEAVSQRDAEGWFIHCGYSVPCD